MSKNTKQRQPTASDSSAEVERWFSPDGEQIRVEHPDGRVILIGEEPRTIPPGLAAHARRKGAVSTKLPAAARRALAEQSADDDDANDPKKRLEALCEAITEAISQPEGAEGYETAFTANGAPNLRWLSSKVGFDVESYERDQAWELVKREIDRQREQSGGKTNDTSDVE